MFIFKIKKRLGIMSQPLPTISQVLIIKISIT
ncbi:hypothetical protein M456_0205820 [Staphylococcus epidermidis MC28]|nr:hypothetical protein M462_0210825 [Staphylococcus epidermidis CIM28]ESV10102.1 hypothetical protein M456_0205820 [Staphylococcus epidermidis MC28]ESV30340.1 hypothetical protein M451_0202485 [Staphylococcus epidermidis APO27]ESV46599.1 hypothetical protein M457_0212450 [Staphylococcus epidermidis Scl19]